MQHREIALKVQRIRLLVKSVDRACGEDTELLSQWAKYICVLSAGLLETAIKDIYSDFANRNVSEPIANYVSSQLSQIRSPKANKFIETATAFKPAWGQELQSFMEENGRDDAINSIILNRHHIAHGNEKYSAISFVQIKTYLEKSIEVIEFADNLCRR